MPTQLHATKRQHIQTNSQVDAFHNCADSPVDKVEMPEHVDTLFDYTYLVSQHNLHQETACLAKESDGSGILRIACARSAGSLTRTPDGLSAGTPQDKVSLKAGTAQTPP